MIIIWFNFYLRYWKANEQIYALKWGVSEITNKNNLEHDREEYECNHSIPIFSSNISKESVFKKVIAHCTSFIITFAMIIFTISSLVYLQDIQMKQEENNEIDDLFYQIISSKKKSREEDSSIIPFLIGIYIKILSIIFDYICIKLTDGENHQKESKYQKSYLLKTIIFNMVNNYFSFYYIIFIKGIKNSCPQKDCFTYLGNQIRDIYTSYFIAALIEMVIPFIANSYLVSSIKNIIQANYPDASAEKIKKIKSSIIRKYGYILYPSYKTADMNNEYIDIIILFGYVTQFAIVEPSLFLIFSIYIFIQRIIDSTKICSFFNVEVFDATDGIGIYNKILKLLSLLSTIINLYILFFIKGIDQKLISKPYHWYAFIIVQNLFLILIFFMDVDMLPNWVNNYSHIREDFIKARNKYVKSKPNTQLDINTTKGLSLGGKENNQQMNNPNNLQIDIPQNEVAVVLNIKETFSSKSKEKIEF
jgi:hypothetical protein